MTNDTEARALGAALSAPAFVTRGHGVAMHAANRHVERWAPEANAGRVRSMRSLGFVDRLVAPWIETAQRSASLRVFNQYAQSGAGEREPGAVSWVFPRPWYQDELDWMAAARRTSAQAAVARQTAPSLITTRGTFVPPARSEIAAPQVVMPSALYEYVAPSLSIASGQQAPIAGVGYGGEMQGRVDAYSPLLSLAAVQAAELMSRAVAPLAGAPGRTGGAGAATAGRSTVGAAAPTAITPGLRAVLTSILERAAAPAAEAAPSRLSLAAPELVTPPHPRASELAHGAAEAGARGASASMTAASSTAESAATPSFSVASAHAAAQVAEQYAAQRARLVELQRIAQHTAQREAAARAEALAARPATDPAAGQAAPASADAREAARVAAQAEALAQAAHAARAARGATTLPSRSEAESAAAGPSAAAAKAAEAAAAVAADEVRSTAARAEAELRQRATVTRAAGAQRQAEAAVERARLEERVAQHASAQRLHEQARTEAAAHARMSLEPARRTDASASAVRPPAAQVPAEVRAAIAALPPELAALLEPAVSQRPDRALQIINELKETLRTAELLARSSASGASFEPTRGPRTVMPAGLGGLVAAVDRAQSLADRPAMPGGRRPFAPLGSIVEPGARPSAAGAHAQAQAQIAAAQAARAARVPALAWLSVGARAQAMASSTALGATTTSAPAALSHVAWSDRWLARFAGAAPQSLDLITASAGAAPALRTQALALAAPGAVFVAPDFLRGDPAAERGAQGRPGSLAAAAFAASRAPAGPAAVSSPSLAASQAISAEAAAAAGIPGMRQINPPVAEAVRRFDDAEETPDDVFAAIAQAASRGRGRAAAPAPARARDAAPDANEATGPAGRPGSLAAATGGPGQVERQTYADLVAHSAPSAPGAGLSAQLASSPVAPALRHVLPMPAAASFDVRSLFGPGLAASYLAGLLAADSRELQIGTQLAPLWASWDAAPIGAVRDPRGDAAERMVPGFDAAYVAPEAPRGPDAQGASEAAAALEAGALEAAALEARAAMEARGARAGIPGELAGSDAGAPAVPAGLAAALAAADRGANIQLTTLRSALLSWGLTITDDTAAQPGVPQLVPTTFATGATGAPRDAALSSSAARMMIDAMTLPMLSEADSGPASAWAAPGMVAERAHSWSIAQERSSSDLALDFVTPELVLAARVYGLGPAEVAQAARLAIVGAGQLGAMASTVDRTFVDAMAIVRDARTSDERRQRTSAAGAARFAAPGAPGELVAPGAARSVTPADGDGREIIKAAAPARGAIITAFPTSEGAAAAVAPTTRATAAMPSTGVAFGVDRRSPRGAFLWPQATVAALGMTAAGSDGQLSMSVAALELLAAQVVAEVGTYAALSEADASARRFASRSSLDAAGLADGDLPAAAGAERSAAVLRAPQPGAATIPGAGTAGGAAGAPASAAAPGGEPGEAEVLGAAAALVPAARRARFDALYVALGQSTAGRSWSPAVRAARALALAGRGDEAPISARERAATAWDVLPVVYAGAVAAGASADATAAAAAAAAIMSSSHAAPDGFGAVGPASGVASGTAAAGAGARLGGGAGSRDVVAPGAGGSGARVGAALGAGLRGAAGFASGGFEVGLDRSLVTVGPGLSGLSARAGDALGAYVAPVAPPSAPRERRDGQSAGAVLRPPSAAPEYVQTARSGGRYGGGELEIPPWFEAAARKMLTDRGDGDGISLAELTLVSAAPASHIAASSRSAPSAAPPAPSGGSAAGQSPNAPHLDIDKLANDVYRQILAMMDAARARNGEPYL
ncbi:MAG TPA: hypothetical protein VFT22_00350 [Kofleriaceae bacterium]|nr:hypothetical protein [Kofleriaceae bacterium]